MEKNDLKPASVFHFFEEVCQVPRPSKKEEKIRAFLIGFAQERGLEYKTDEAGNLLIMKPATPGKENLKKVVLQSHMDMVCEKNKTTEHNFDTDPIRTYVDGEWLKAQGTTLGADNGIGIATELAVLDAKDIAHGPIECLFTVDEETGLTGAFALKDGFMSGDILINLDSEDEGELFIGCAGGAGTTAQFPCPMEAAPAGYFFFRVAVKGLTGGHSGDDINKGRANANKVLNRYLVQLMNRYDLRLCEIDGGNLHNAIPREAHAVCAVPMEYKEAVRVDLNVFLAEVENEYAVTEPKLTMELESETPCAEVHETFPFVHLCSPQRGLCHESGYAGTGGDIVQSGIYQDARREDYRRNQSAQFHPFFTQGYVADDPCRFRTGWSGNYYRRRLSGLEAESVV